MRRIRLGTAGTAAAMAALAFTAGCAAPSATAQVPVSPATTPSATTGAPSTAASPDAGSRPGTPSTTARALPRGYDAKRDAKADIQAALAEAAKDHKEVLVDFGANWCADCRALDVMFRSAQVEPLLRKDYVVVSVDVGKFDHNLDVAAQYVDLQTSGIPALVVLKSNGEPRTATNDGAFSSAATMNPGQVSDFLTRWAPAGDQ
ncbi:thioredoxin family protein [Streptomyces sp. NPDC054956]